MRTVFYFLATFLILFAFVYSSSVFFVALEAGIEKSIEAAENANAASLRLVEFFIGDFRSGPEENRTASLIFVGDVMLSRGVEHYAEINGDYRFPFLLVADFLNGADFVFGNLEGSLSERGADQGSVYSFRAKPEAAAGLKFAGFDLVSLANNHIWDWGAAALIDTIDHLASWGIGSVGAGRNEAEANAPFIYEIKGTKFAFLAYTNLYPKAFEAMGNFPGVSNFSAGRIRETIQSLKKEVDLVFVSIHWGEEYQRESSPEQQRIGRAMIDAGADFIVGHHPHVIQEIEEYKGKWIAYSLGNFVFDQGFSDETMRGLAVKVKVEGGKIVEVEPVEVRLNRYFQPRLGG